MGYRAWTLSDRNKAAEQVEFRDLEKISLTAIKVVDIIEQRTGGEESVETAAAIGQHLFER